MKKILLSFVLVFGLVFSVGNFQVNALSMKQEEKINMYLNNYYNNSKQKYWKEKAINILKKINKKVLNLKSNFSWFKKEVLDFIYIQINNLILKNIDKNDLSLNNLEITGKICDKENEVDWDKCEWNYVWGAAMNFAWNELKENILKENIILDTQDEKALELTKKLNYSIISKNILNEESYYIKSGYWQKTVDIINKESKEKFPKKSFWDLRLELKDKDIISYAYFYKKVEYKVPFEEKNVNFKWKEYKWFEAWNDKQRKNVKILNYENDDKFIIKLALKDDSDELILVKWYDMENPNEAIKKINKYDKENLKNLEYSDVYHDFFEVPNIKLNYHRGYKYMIWKKLWNKNFLDYEIAQMFEDIKFNMNYKWAKVENQAVIAMQMTSAWPWFNEKIKYKTRYFHLNKNFWVIMKRKNSDIPYFILWISNWNLMQYINFVEN